MAATKDLRQQWQSARKSAPVSAGGVNVRRLALHGLSAASTTTQDAHDEEQEDRARDETTRSAACGNPFCRKVLANRYASFCEDKRMCQRYRALKLQCLANAQAEEDEEDTRPLSLVIKRRKRRDKSSDAQAPAEAQARARATVHSSGREDKGLTVARVAVGAAASDEKRRSSVKSPREREKESTPRKKKRKKVVKQVDREETADDDEEEEEEEEEGEEQEAEDEEDGEEKKRDKRVKWARDGHETDGLVGRLRSGGQTPPSVSAADEPDAHADNATKKSLSRAQLSTETSGDGKPGIGSSSLRIKRRRLDGRLSTGKAASPRFVSSSPKHVTTPPAASAADASWTIPRAASSQERTSVQQIRRSMDADLVPLGVAKSAKSTGGGRYVQNGNRSVSNVLRPSNPRPRPPSMSKFPVLSVSAPASSVLSARASPTFVSTTRQQPSPQHKRPWLPLPPQTSVAAPPPLPPQTSVTVPPPPPPPPRQTSAPAPPPLPPKNFGSAPPPVPRPAARTVASSPLSANSFAAPAAIDLPAPTAPAASDVSRISTLTYLKSKKGVSERQLPGHQTNVPPPQTPSPERVSSVSGGHALGISMIPACPPGPPRYRNDGAPLLSYAESRLVVDTRRHYSEIDAKNQRLHSGAEEDAMQYRERPKAVGALERSASGHWKDRNFLSPRERTLLRQQDAYTAGVRSSGSEYSMDTYVRSSPSSYEQPNRKKTAHKEPLPPQHASASCRSEQRVNHEPRKSGHDDDEDDAPTFSYRESFLPHLLSVFIHKFPHSLEAVYNVTKKPRKMIWYVKTIERIEHICRPFDLKVKFDGLKAVVTVRDREWLTLEGTSTVLLHLNVMKVLRNEAVTWLRLYEEMETAFAYYRSMYGSQANESYCFLRAWNNLKNTGNHIALSREVNYFCGTRLHHWNFVVGKVEIGSGSHEEKREAFRLATISSLYFLLSIGRGVRRPSVERTRALDDRDVSEESHRSSSREPAASRIVRSPDDRMENSISAASSPSIGLSSPVESRQAVVQPSTERLPMSRDDATRSATEAPSTGRQPSPVQPSTGQLPVARDDATRSPAEAPSTGRQPPPVQSSTEQLPVARDDATRSPAEVSSTERQPPPVQPSTEQLPAQRGDADRLCADKPSITQRPAEEGSPFSAEVHSDTAPVSSGSHESAETVDKRCPSKEMDTSDVNATCVSSSAEPPRIPMKTRATSSANAREPTATRVSGLTPDRTVSSASAVVVSGPAIPLGPPRPAVAAQSEPPAFVPAPIMAPSGASAAAAGNMGSAIQRGIPALQTKATTPSSRRCMMCEMIRMRKPDGERCLRCQQKDVPANGAFGALLWP